MNMKNKLVILVLIFVSISSFGQNKKIPSKQTQGVSVNVLIKNTLSTAGGDISGINYTVTSSIGQIDAGHISNGGSYQFIGGILAAPRNNQLFKNGFE